MSRTESNPLYKIIVLGDGGVGKTALTIQLCLNHFVETYDPTIEDSYRKQVTIDGQPATLEVLDTAGQEEYTALRDQWVRDGEGFLLVYSITSRSSFSRIKNYYDQIERVKDKDPFAVVLVGNKSDRTGERQVSESDGLKLAKSLGADTGFFESSAKLNINIEEAFFQCARLCRKLRSMPHDNEDANSPLPGTSPKTRQDSEGRQQLPSQLQNQQQPSGQQPSHHHHLHLHHKSESSNQQPQAQQQQQQQVNEKRKKGDKKSKCTQM